MRVRVAQSNPRHLFKAVNLVVTEVSPCQELFVTELVLTLLDSETKFITILVSYCLIKN